MFWGWARELSTLVSRSPPDLWLEKRLTPTNSEAHLCKSMALTCFCSLHSARLYFCIWVSYCFGKFGKLVKERLTYPLMYRWRNYRSSKIDLSKITAFYFKLILGPLTVSPSFMPAFLECAIHMQTKIYILYTDCLSTVRTSSVRDWRHSPFWEFKSP